MELIGDVLGIDKSAQVTIEKLMLERQLVLNNKFF